MKYTKTEFEDDEIEEEEEIPWTINDLYYRIEELQSLGKAINKVQKNEYKKLIDEYNRLVGFKSMRV